MWIQYLKCSEWSKRNANTPLPEETWIYTFLISGGCCNHHSTACSSISCRKPSTFYKILHVFFDRQWEIKMDALLWWLGRSSQLFNEIFCFQAFIYGQKSHLIQSVFSPYCIFWPVNWNISNTHNIILILKYTAENLACSLSEVCRKKCLSNPSSRFCHRHLHPQFSTLFVITHVYWLVFQNY